jgi:hypothetical protein
LRRLKWHARIHPGDYVIGVPLETFHLLREAKMTFVEGNFVATILVCGAFIEHVLSSQLESRGFSREARSGIRSIVECLRGQQSRLEPILDQVVHMQNIRNSFVHLKPFNHPYVLGQRSMKSQRPDIALLEEDAKRALSLMYTVAVRTAW